jgi:hypothetical protein
LAADFRSVSGEVCIERDGATIWKKTIETGEENMSHSLANLEHNHFKFKGHQLAGQVHIHFLGAHSLSFGDHVELQDGDWMLVRYDGYGRALRNSVRREVRSNDTQIRGKELS